MDNVFGQPENMQPENVQKEGNNPTLIAVLLILILIGGAALAFLMYRQGQEPAPVLDEVVETVELPSDTEISDVTNELPIVEDSATISDESTIDNRVLENETILTTPVE
jgi:flagellar basal body-associated protein FliL